MLIPAAGRARACYDSRHHPDILVHTSDRPFCRVDANGDLVMLLRARSLLNVQSRWQSLCRVLAVALLAVFVTGCAGLIHTPVPTVTPLPFYATAAADPGWLVLQQRPLHLPALAPGTACPHARGRLLSPEFNLALGGGPAYPILAQATEEGGVLHYVDAAHYMGARAAGAVRKCCG